MAVGLQINSIFCFLYLLYTIYLPCKFTKFGTIKQVNATLENKNGGMPWPSAVCQAR